MSKGQGQCKKIKVEVKVEVKVETNVAVKVYNHILKSLSQ